VRLLEIQGVKSISGGTYIIPCIKGTADLRQVVDNDVLCAILPKLKFIITSEKSVVSICEAFGKKAFIVSQIDCLTVDGLNMVDANQAINYMNQKLITAVEDIKKNIRLLNVTRIPLNVRINQKLDAVKRGRAFR
jgi:hypothetical protein